MSKFFLVTLVFLLLVSCGGETTGGDGVADSSLEEALSVNSTRLAELEDIRYITIWDIRVGRSGKPEAIVLFQVVDRLAVNFNSKFSPSEVFIKESKMQIANMMWEYIEDENGEPQSQAALCHLLISNPDSPICSNNMER